MTVRAFVWCSKVAPFPSRPDRRNHWAMPALTRPAKITFSEMRDTGVRGILIYCSDYKCSTRLQSAATDGLMTSGSPISKRGSYAKPEEREGLISGRTSLEQAAGRDHGISVVPWSRRFDEPIPTKGKLIVTLQDAAQFILKLPKAEQNRPHWQAAAEAVIMATEDRGPLMDADIGMKWALNAGKPAEFDPKRKSPHWGKRKLQRDQ